MELRHSSPERVQPVGPELYFSQQRSSTIKCRPVKPLRSRTIPDDSIASSSSRAEPNDQSITGSSVYRYLAPKVSFF